MAGVIYYIMYFHGMSPLRNKRDIHATAHCSDVNIGMVYLKVGGNVGIFYVCPYKIGIYEEPVGLIRWLYRRIYRYVTGTCTVYENIL